MQCLHCIAPRCVCLMHLSTGSRHAHSTTLLRVTFSVSERVLFVLCVTLPSYVAQKLFVCDGSLAFASLPFYFVAYFRSALDALRRFPLPENLNQTGTLSNSWLLKTLWIYNAFHFALFAAQIIRHLSLWFPELVSIFELSKNTKRNMADLARKNKFNKNIHNSKTARASSSHLY